MSYLFIIIIGAVIGFVAGQYVKGSELGPVPDIGAGAIGAFVAVLLSRLVGPAGASGFVVSFAVSVIGAIALLYVMRRFMKEKPLPAARVRRRR